MCAMNFREYLLEIECWKGYKKDGTQSGTGKNKGKRVNKCIPEEKEKANINIKKTKGSSK
jgi:hypothetical protein